MLLLNRVHVLAIFMFNLDRDFIEFGEMVKVISFHFLTEVLSVDSVCKSLSVAFTKLLKWLKQANGYLSEEQNKKLDVLATR